MKKLNSEEEEIADAAAQIAKQKAQLKLKSQAKHINRAIIPRKAKNVTLKEFTTGMRQIGLDPKHLERRAAVLSEKEKAAYEAYVKRQEAREAAEGGMDVDAGDVEMEDGESSARGVAARGPKTNRQLAGMATEAVRTKCQRFLPHTRYSCFCLYSKPARRPSCESLPSENPTGWRGLRNPIVISRSRGQSGCCRESESRAQTRDVRTSVCSFFASSWLAFLGVLAFVPWGDRFGLGDGLGYDVLAHLV